MEWGKEASAHHETLVRQLLVCRQSARSMPGPERHFFVQLALPRTVRRRCGLSGMTIKIKEAIQVQHPLVIFMRFWYHLNR
jgi:hypothetical protein